MTHQEAAVLRAVASYGLRLGLFARDGGVEALAAQALRSLNEDYNLPPVTHDGWDFTLPIPAPEGEEKARFVRIGNDGGGFG